VAAGAALAACTADDDHIGAGGDGPKYPSVVTHQFGNAWIRKQPERVVSLGLGDADVLLALGVKPVGILDWLKVWPQGVGPWAQPRLGGAQPELLTGPNINVDAVATIAPDLVTFARSDNLRATWQRLDKVAPTISGPLKVPPPTISGRPATQPFETSWKDQATIIAAAVGRLAHGEKLVADTEAAVAAVKSANPGFAGKTVCVAAALAGRYLAYIRLDDRVQFMEAIGFTNSPKMERIEPASPFAAISRSSAAWLDADLTVVFGIGAGAKLRNDPILNSIPSARSGRLLFIDDADLVHSFATNTVLSIPYALQRFVPLARKALGL
jgi:iron complex transport system substrate-binding protein